MTTYRMISPGKTPNSPILANGRTYSQTPGQAINVEAADEPILSAAGWITIGQSGPTAARPTSSSADMYSLNNPASRVFYDTTLGKVIFHDGAVWRDPANGSAV
jgi:hypothetical protein